MSQRAADPRSKGCDPRKKKKKAESGPEEPFSTLPRGNPDYPTSSVQYRRSSSWPRRRWSPGNVTRNSADFAHPTTPSRWTSSVKRARTDSSLTRYKLVYRSRFVPVRLRGYTQIHVTRASRSPCPLLISHLNNVRCFNGKAFQLSIQRFVCL